MAGRKNKKRELPVTGLLAGTIAVLLICLALLIRLNLQSGQTENEGQRAEHEETLQSGKLEKQEKAVSETGRQEDETGKPREKMQDADSEVANKETQPQGMTGEEGEEKQQSAVGANGEEEQQTTVEANGEEEQQGMTESEKETELQKHHVVAIDPGHQGSWVNMSEKEPNGPGSTEMKAKATTGTQGAFSGKAEYELNLEVSLLLREELEERGYEVILTREDHDAAISNSERALMAYEKGGEIYVRIHANGASDPGVSGALAMVPSAENPYVGNLAEDSFLLADCILSAYCEKASFGSLGIQYYDNMTGINWSRLPVMILEMGFMTNQADDLRMADPQVQMKMAEGIADGIDAYFTEKDQRTVPEEDVRRMNTLIEQLSDEFLLPAQEQGERWAVSIRDLSSGAEGNLGGKIEMASASVVKVFLMATVFDSMLSDKEETVDILVTEEGTGELVGSVAVENPEETELLQLISDMITVSDNASANELLRRLGNGDASAGIAKVNAFCEENGFQQTRMGRKFLEENPQGDNMTSAEDCSRLLEQIYRGECVSRQASEKMYGFLKQQTRIGKIPAGLAGTGAQIANKTGELAGDYGQFVENDIAIVEQGGKAYILCILSGNLKDNGDAIRRIGEISKVVYGTLSVQ